MMEAVSFAKNLKPTPRLGQGVGLRTPHYAIILRDRPKISWFEALSENYMGTATGDGGRPIHILKKIRENYPIVLHGVSLSIGSTDSLNHVYLKKLKKLISRIEPEWVSDHLCWTGVDGENLHDLLPLPFTQECVRHVTERIQAVQDFLGRRMLFENVSSYFTYSHSEMTEWEFIAELVKRSGCGVLLDVNNIHVSAVNHGFNALDYLNAIPVAAVEQFHLAGYSDMGTHLIDTHDHPVSDPVWKLYEAAVERFGGVPTLIEWDDHIPELSVLMAESEKASRIQEKTLDRKTTTNQLA